MSSMLLNRNDDDDDDDDDADARRTLPPHLQLLQACQVGNLAVVQRLLLQEGTANATQITDGHSPLREACRNGHYHIVRLLLAAGENSSSSSSGTCNSNNNSLGATPLHLAACRGHEEICRMLLQQDPDSVHVKSWDGWTVLHWAAAYGNVHVVRYLLRLRLPHERVAVVNPAVRDGLSGYTALHTACRWGHLNVVKELYYKRDDDDDDDYHDDDDGNLVPTVVYTTDDDGCTALHVAAAAGWFSIVNYLLEQGADARLRNNKGETPRDVCLQHSEDIRALLEEAMNEETSSSKNNSVTPAAVTRTDATTTTTTDTNTTSDITETETTTTNKLPLHEASRRGNVEAVDFWVHTTGADINAVRGGTTPLHEAIRHDRVQVVAWFLENGANTAIRDAHGQTARDVACAQGHEQVLELLDDRTVQNEEEDDDDDQPPEIPFTVLKMCNDDDDDDDNSFQEDIPLPVLTKSANIASNGYLFQDAWVGPLICDGSDDDDGDEPRYHQELAGGWTRLCQNHGWDPIGNDQSTSHGRFLSSCPPFSKNAVPNAKLGTKEQEGSFEDLPLPPPVMTSRRSSGSASFEDFPLPPPPPVMKSCQSSGSVSCEDFPLPLPVMKSCRSTGSEISCRSSVDSRDAEAIWDQGSGDRFTGSVPQRKYKPMSLLS